MGRTVPAGFPAGSFAVLPVQPRRMGHFAPRAEIAVFRQGAVIQQGTHEELVGDETGEYYELWHAQAQYYTEESA